MSVFGDKVLLITGGTDSFGNMVLERFLDTKELFQVDGDISFIGIRHGEKVYETLATVEERTKAQELERDYRIPADHRDLNCEKYDEMGVEKVAPVEAYTSYNTLRLTVSEVKDKLLGIPYAKEQLELWGKK